MKRTTFAWGLVGCLVLVSSTRADEPGVVVLDQVGPSPYTVRAQSADSAAAEDGHGKAPAAPPSSEPESVHDYAGDQGHGAHGHHAHGMPMYGSMSMHGYGDWTSSPGCYPMTGCCCSDEGWKPTGNAILDAPVEVTTAIFKGIFCHCNKCGSCSRCGPGRTPHCGTYRLNYPVNPWYFDQRDGQVYSAQGYGAPMAVPLAPCVRKSYNYSWGVPSSRISPISRMPGQGGY